MRFHPLPAVAAAAHDGVRGDSGQTGYSWVETRIVMRLTEARFLPRCLALAIYRVPGCLFDLAWCITKGVGQLVYNIANAILGTLWLSITIICSG